jgi:16S rRNA (guanine1207-N2)-methyltransferase
MNSSDFWQNFVNKQITFRYMRQELQFNLSQSLFSSADVDIGSHFLLRTIARNVDIAHISSVLDIGCGVGVLGLSLKKINPDIQLLAQDRDALAMIFTAQNAALNELEDVTVQGGLAFQGNGGRKFDLIISNLPGKAGHDVLQDMLYRMPAYLSETGMAAIVVVKPLAELVEETLADMECDILLREEVSGYEVLHFRGGVEEVSQRRRGAEENLDPYIRTEQKFKLGKQSVEMRTVWNLPEFDSLAYDTALAINALKKRKVSGRVLFWNPGQGHMPMYLREQVGEFELAGRDSLSLQVAEMNLRRAGVDNVSTLHIPHFLEVSGQYDWLIIFPDVDPGVAWENVLLPHCARLLNSGGRVLLVAKSAYAYRFLKEKRRFQSKFDRKRNGYRAVILVKK